MPLSISGRPPEAQAIRAIHAALDAGVTLIDTADVYCLDDSEIGHNERLIAKALKQWPGHQDRVIVATKGGLTRPGGRWERCATPAHLRRACDASLAALGVKRIDLYQLHAPDARVPFKESVAALAELRAAGKVRWLGLSNVSVDQIEQARGIVEITTVQNRLSPFFREAIQSDSGIVHLLRVLPLPESLAPARRISVVGHCAEHGIGFLAYSPVGGGRLNLRLADHPTLVPIARRLGVSPHAVALAWVLAQGPSVIPIPGARSPEHVRDGVRAADIALTRNDLEAIGQASFAISA
jgi:aryl-alcohol dehydrogenase-like predicted oxidoreductase